MDILVALMAETSANPAALNTEKPGPHENGTLCVVRSTGRIYYWNGGPSGVWGQAQLA